MPGAHLPVASSSRHSRLPDHFDGPPRQDSLLHNIPPSLLHRPPRDIDWTCDPIATITDKRSGIILKASHPVLPETEHLEALSSVELTLGVGKDIRLPETSGHLAQVVFTRIVNEQPIPDGLCDIASMSLVEALGRKQERTLAISKLSDSFYLIDAKLREQSSWFLVMPHATAVLEVLRRSWGPTKEAIVIELVKRGIPFFTMLPGSTMPMIDSERVPFDIYPSSFRPTSSDYSIYELRRDILLSGPRGRAALMMGGIIWRLAKEVLDDADVMDGPSYCLGSEFRISTTHDTLADNALTSDELQIICGTYRIFTGKLCDSSP